MAAIDKIRDTASSHEYHFLVEVMGREAGFLAAEVGIASGAECILTPEFPLTDEQLAEILRQPKRKKSSCIVVVAEAGQPGRSLTLQRTLQHLTQLHFRVCILGHIQRGGSPSTRDRVIASRLGELAIQAVLQQKNRCMAAWQREQATLVALPHSQQSARRLSDDALLQLGHVLAS